MSYLKHKPGSLEESVMNVHEKSGVWFVKDVDGKKVHKGTYKTAMAYLKHRAGSHTAYKDGHEHDEEKINEARYRVSGQMGYKGIGGTDGFEMVINATSERDAINKAEKELDKARRKRHIGPGGGGNLEDVDIEGAEKTTDPLESPSSFMLH